MILDKRTFLESLTDDELLGELARRANEAQRRADRLNAATGSGPKFKSVAKSQAKQQYWAEYRAWLASHPGGSVKQWQKERKKGHTT
jgi:hypothetical protein